MTGIQAPKGWSLALSRLGSLLISIALAFVIWLYVNNLENPLDTRVFDQRIQVTIYGLDPNLQPIQDLSTEDVAITVRAPRKVWGDLTAKVFSAHIDLTGMGIGSHTVPIIVDSTNPQADIVEVQQPSLTIQLDRVAHKELPVAIKTIGQVAIGFESKPATVNPISVTVSGPQTQVDLVSEIMGTVDLLDAKSQVEQSQPLKALNRQGRAVTGVTITPNIADIVVPIEQQRGLKTVAVRLELIGQPAYGYRLSTVKVEPSTVILQGDPQVIDAVPGFIETEPLDLTDVQSEINKQIALIPPAGTSVLDGEVVSVRVSIAPLEDSRTIKAQLIVRNAGKGYEVTKALDVVDVIISGPLTLVDGVSRDDIFAMLNLSGLLPGTHTIVPEIALPEGVRAEGVLPETVEVVIVDKSTPTPSASDVVTDVLQTPVAPITATATITTP